MSRAASHRSATGPLLALAASLLLAGCSTLDLESVPLIAQEDETEIPTRIVPVWTDAVLHRDGQAVRGFGGRVIFYGSENEAPIKVSGVVVVYAWDDTGSSLSQKPDRKYVFRPEDLDKHYSDSKIGHSYSLWIPWDHVGGSTHRITLITRFISTQGGETSSAAAHMVLPGSGDAALLPTPREASSESRIDPAAFERIMSADEDGDSTTTISLPEHLARLKGGVASEAGETDDAHVDLDELMQRLDAVNRARRASAVEASGSEAEAEPEEVSATRSSPNRSLAQTATSARRSAHRVRREPHRATWPSGLPPTPRGGLMPRRRTTVAGAATRTAERRQKLLQETRDRQQAAARTRQWWQEQDAAD